MAKDKLRLETKGDWGGTINKIKNAQTVANLKHLNLDKYGTEGVEALKSWTPRETGKTAMSWGYRIVDDKKGSVTLEWFNTNVSHYIPVAILIQYGHASRNGTWVDGVDYINPALKPIFDKISDKIRKDLDYL